VDADAHGIITQTPGYGTAPLEHMWKEKSLSSFRVLLVFRLGRGDAAHIDNI
jgi:hypothetical protein